MNEKSKVSTSENEYKKQLISMTSTIDNLAEDKELLMQKL
jgi:chromosome segregation ATPase